MVNTKMAPKDELLLPPKEKRRRRSLASSSSISLIKVIKEAQKKSIVP